MSHQRLLLQNRTGIEFYENDKDASNPYDVGMFRNVQSVMGSNPLFWLLPLRVGVVGDGLSFVRNESAKPKQT